jgi:hypothetical protein
MKKLILGLFSLITVSCFAQSAAVTADQKSITPEQGKEILVNTMANFTKGVSFAYTKGVTYKQFKSTLCGASKPIAEGDAMLLAAFNYLSTGATKEDIIREDNGKAVYDAMKYSYNIHAKGIVAEPDGTELFGGKSITNSTVLAKNEAGCRWYQFWCHVQTFANWVIANWQTIKDILVVVVTLFP